MSEFYFIYCMLVLFWGVTLAQLVKLATWQLVKLLSCDLGSSPGNSLLLCKNKAAYNTPNGGTLSRTLRMREFQCTGLPFFSFVLLSVISYSHCCLTLSESHTTARSGLKLVWCLTCWFFDNLTCWLCVSILSFFRIWAFFFLIMCSLFDLVWISNW